MSQAKPFDFVIQQLNIDWDDEDPEVDFLDDVVKCVKKSSASVELDECVVERQRNRAMASNRISILGCV